MLQPQHLNPTLYHSILALHHRLLQLEFLRVLRPPGPGSPLATSDSSRRLCTAPLAPGTAPWFLSCGVWGVQRKDHVHNWRGEGWRKVTAEHKCVYRCLTLKLHWHKGLKKGYVPFTVSCAISFLLYQSQYCISHISVWIPEQFQCPTRAVERIPTSSHRQDQRYLKFCICLGSDRHPIPWLKKKSTCNLQI